MSIYSAAENKKATSGVDTQTVKIKRSATESVTSVGIAHNRRYPELEHPILMKFYYLIKTDV